MSKKRDSDAVTRRNFLEKSAAAATVVAAGGALAGCPADDPDPPTFDGLGQLPDQGPPSELGPDITVVKKSSVVDVKDSTAMNGRNPDPSKVKAMLAAGLKKLSGASDLAGAWKVLLPGIGASNKIGIKVNCLSASFSNSPVVVKALVDTLVADLGVPAKNIIVWDRRTDELTRGKFSSSAVGGVQVLGTITSTSDSSGPGYETTTHSVNGQTTHLSKILTERTDVTINLPLLKTHEISGATGAMKNTYGCIDNPGSFHDKLNADLPAIYALSPIRGRIKLHITEALMAVVKGGTTSSPDALPGRLLLSTDPLALDTQAVRLINTLRGTRPPLPSAKTAWLTNAVGKGIGSPAYDYHLVNLG